MAWDAGTYEQFAAERERPLLDMLARVPHTPKTILDAGCGTGRTTHALATRWPKARVVGIDSSAEMLAEAKPADRVQFKQADLATWTPEAPFDLVVSNAVLHWLPNPVAALSRMLDWGDMVAVQVPNNFEADSHRIIEQAAAKHDLHPTGKATRFHIEQAIDTAARTGRHVDAWETTYHHRLAGSDAVLNWLRGTALRPYLEAGAGAEFVAEVSDRLSAAYPVRAGVTHFPFRRRFLVAYRP